MTICWGQCQYPFTARDKPHQGSTANGRPAFRVQPRLLTLAPVTPMAGGQTPAASRAVDPRPQNSRYGTPDPFDGKAIWTTQIGGYGASRGRGPLSRRRLSTVGRRAAMYRL